MSSDQFTWIAYLISALLFFTAGSVNQVSWVGYSASTWWAVFGNILFPTLLGHALFTHLLKYLNINWMSCGKLMEPVFASLVASLVFSERLKSQTAVAFAFTALSVVILLLPPGALAKLLGVSHEK